MLKPITLKCLVATTLNILSCLHVDRGMVSLLYIQKSDQIIHTVLIKVVRLI